MFAYNFTINGDKQSSAYLLTSSISGVHIFVDDVYIQEYDLESLLFHASR